MEKITYYKVADKKANGKNNDLFRFIPIENILFDRGMVKKVNEVCSGAAKQKGIKVLQRNGFSLSKWDSVLKNIKDCKPLDPIIVKQFKKTKYYEVIDGRHRAVVSLYEHFTHVPVIIIKSI